MNQHPKKIVLFGAGNIGRSFIAQVFARDGYEIVFVDINDAVIAKINAEKQYDVINLNPDGTKDNYTVTQVRAVDGKDRDAVIAELCSADIASTSVGKQALQYIVGTITEAAQLRFEEKKTPLDVILAENIRDGREYMLGLAKEYLDKKNGTATSPEHVAAILGFVETSIGKMVPLQDSGENLDVFCEPYNTLILSRDGFHQTPPALPQIKAVANVQAWVDRKLFIHNLGHATCAYVGRMRNPETEYLWESLKDPYVEWKVRTVMSEAGAILRAEYPEEFSQQDIEDHVNDLVERFKNRFLGDTVYRVGRDLARKLHKSDRVLGAILLGIKHNLSTTAILDAYFTACSFGKLGNDESDSAANDIFMNQGPAAVLQQIGGLTGESSEEKTLIAQF